MEEDSPPSYSDAMAAIAEGIKQQGIRSQQSFTTTEVSENFSDVIAIFTPTMRSLNSDELSFQRINSSIPSEPPPPYTDVAHSPPQSAAPSPASFLHGPCSSSTSTSMNSIRSHVTSVPDQGIHPRRQIGESEDKVCTKNRNDRSTITTTERKQPEEPTSAASILEPINLDNSRLKPINPWQLVQFGKKKGKKKNLSRL